MEPVITFFLGIVCGSLAAVAVAAATGVDLGDDRVTLPVTVASLAGLWVAYVAAVVFTSRRRGTGHPIKDVRLRIEALGDIPFGIGVGIASWIGVAMLHALLDAIGLLDADEAGERARELADAARGAGFLVLFVFVAIGAPIVEEVFFRGFLQPPLVRRTSPVVGVVLGGILFGLAHARVVELPGLAAFGIVLGALAHSTRRLGPSIVTHMTFNALTLTTLLLTR